MKQYTTNDFIVVLNYT